VGGRETWRRKPHVLLHWIQSVVHFLRNPIVPNYDIKLTCFYHRYVSDYEKIIAAAADFTSGRVWPVNFASESGPKFIWEKVKFNQSFLDQSYG
jgi:hypothetical protein